ncbi:MAG: hypothetical protein S4CHLAM81_03140 [Chlamydiales bacterium]|nr:hypothetical protein [Chlamydiales bacterium]MCH9635104.1 hypothetical protein [Chlamydiales bacterium]
MSAPVKFNLGFLTVPPSYMQEKVGYVPQLFACGQCGKSFKKASNLRAHAKSAHMTDSKKAVSKIDITAALKVVKKVLPPPSTTASVRLASPLPRTTEEAASTQSREKRVSSKGIRKGKNAIKPYSCGHCSQAVANIAGVHTHLQNQHGWIVAEKDLFVFPSGGQMIFMLNMGQVRSVYRLEDKE